MKGYILKRLLSLIPVLFVVAVVVFLIIHITPGDPASVMLGPEASPREVAELREELGLNLPLYQQFTSWLAGVVQGDFGWSIFMNEPVLQSFFSHLGPTLSLAIFAQLLAVMLAIPFGVIAAKRRGTIIDQTFMGGSLIGRI